jgi:hypothetical protein
MPSPFPGMDPYLERSWGDVHASLVTYARDAIQGHLPRDLRARIEERVYVDVPESEIPRVNVPDVHVIEHPAPGQWPAAEGGVATAEPLLVDIPVEPIREGYIQILDVKSGHRVVTTIEFLSPTNKRPGPAHEEFARKHAELRAGGVNTVEVDLLRQGLRGSILPRQESIPEAHRTAYRAVAWRAGRPGLVEVYPAPLRERLPVIRIPLRPGDPDAPLDLQALVDLAYRNGVYDDTDYRGEPEPTLDSDDAAWSDALLRERGRR